MIKRCCDASSQPITSSQAWRCEPPQRGDFYFQVGFHELVLPQVVAYRIDCESGTRSLENRVGGGMFKVIDKTEGHPVVSLDVEWSDTVRCEWLRAQCRAGQMCCPLCRSNVTLRAGEIFRRHFAHDSRSECPFAHENPVRLTGRQLLYSWLCSKLPQGTVQIEEILDNVELPGPVDVVCRLGDHQFGYFFVHRDMRNSEDRNEVTRALQRQSSPHLHVVISTRLVTFDPSGRAFVFLRPSAREFRKQSGANWPDGFGNSLHFLDVETESLTTLRRISLIREPTCYQFDKRKTDKLSDAGVQEETGAIFHPGELDEIKNRIEERKRGDQYWLPPSFRTSDSSIPPTDRQSPSSAWNPRPAVPCEICGFLTLEEDQIVYSGSTKTCRCRECMKRQ